jgi:hypothetical protein
VSRLICDGLWLVSDFEGSSGFGGHGVHGYDVEKKKYVGTWIDSMSTLLHAKEGEWDAAKRTMTLWTEATVHGRSLRWRETTEGRDADAQVWRRSWRRTARNSR